MAIRLEDSTGKTVANPTAQQVRDTVGRIGGDLDHCILELADGGFLQTAGSRGQLFIEYGDQTGSLQEAERNYDNESAGDVFVLAMRSPAEALAQLGVDGVGAGQSGSRARAAGATGTAGASGAASAAAGITGSDAAGAASRASLKDTILSTAKQQASREVQFTLRRFIRRAVGMVLGKRRF
ncbi:hypothetical protein [Spirochaeta africana]|uniref:Uncharacterized protein n=1 Tax=Spirochaeta africana (strain ATCC 700263 / DSM 8902 / Z-7692) TaxID=889378 RepID=H9UG05_SPIAZ|nr:hypothetical protein [Spirochaeta africana]AFG36448.1 hypothetical protein Spiaf_0343 [Spirochaeta africana DSM 8902]